MFVVVPILLFLPLAAIATLVILLTSSFKKRFNQIYSQTETPNSQLNKKIDALDQEIWLMRKQINQLSHSIDIFNNLKKDDPVK